MPPRLAERLTAREDAIILKVIAATIANGAISSSCTASIAPGNTINTQTPAPSPSPVQQGAAGGDDAKAEGKVDLLGRVVETDVTVVDSNVVKDSGDGPTLALSVQCSSKAMPVEASLLTPASASAIADFTCPVDAAAEQDPSDALGNSSSPLSDGPGKSFGVAAKNDTDPEPQPSNNGLSTPDCVDGPEQIPTQERHARPRRIAADKAAGKYFQDNHIEVDDMKGGTQSHLAVHRPPKPPAKRKRGVGRSATNASAAESTDPVVDSGHHKAGKSTHKKQRSNTSARPKQTKRNVQDISVGLDTNIPAEQIIDDDEKDKDFSPSSRKTEARNASQGPKQYSLRDRKGSELVIEHRKQETWKTLSKEISASGKVSYTKTEKMRKKETQTRSSQGSLRGKQVLKERKIGENKASGAHPSSPPEQAAKKKEPLRIGGTFTNKYKIRFGSTPFRHNTRPSAQNCRTVFEILKKHHERDDIKLEQYPSDRNDQANNDSQGPMHAGTDFTFHSIVKTILSQATNNENAQTVEQSLIHQFRFNFLGVKVKGLSPNYHAMRKAPESVVAKALASGGLHNMKAKLIQGCLSHVYNWNMERATEEQRLEAEQIECGESADFVPGMLSLDYMRPMSPQEKFDHLVSMPGIGVKTAACILCFNFEYPVFAVDTHVQRLSRMLRWLPRKANNINHSFMHLDKRVPPELKYGLHQAFWHHGQICIRCRAGSDKNTKGWDNTVCPIEHLVDRSLKDMPKQKKPNAKDGETSEKPKKDKKKPTVYPHSKLTAEQAAKLGYELRTIAIDDGFGVRRANFSGKPLLKWVLKSDLDVVEPAGNMVTAADIQAEFADPDEIGGTVLDDEDEVDDEQAAELGASKEATLEESEDEEDDAGESSMADDDGATFDEVDFSEEDVAMGDTGGDSSGEWAGD